VEVRTVQLSELLRTREAAVIAEVDAALSALRAAIEKRNSARERVRSCEDELDRLTQKQALDDTVTAFDLAEARLGILKARADVVALSVDVLEAQVQLWTAQGVTGAGCGLPGHDAYGCELCPPDDGTTEPTQEPMPVDSPAMPPLAPAPKILPMSGNFRPTLLPATQFQSCRPAEKMSR
jgi:hypothetical protein